MNAPAWLVVKQAREALKNGRPEEAHQLLNGLATAGHRKAHALRGEVVRGYAERAERQLRREDVPTAWADLLRAEALDGTDATVGRLRETLTRLGLAEVRALLEAGEPLRAIEASSHLRERTARHPDFTPLEECAQDWVLAQEMIDRGEFELARQMLARVRKRSVCPTAGVDRCSEELERRAKLFADAFARMQTALDSRDWRSVLRWADEAIIAAPNNREAHQTRTRAWQMVQPEPAPAKPAPAAKPSLTDTVVEPPPVLPRRFYLWIDGVGGYLVCTGPRVTLGQTSTEKPVDVPLFADVSRFACTLTRDEEGYLLEADRPVLVNGQPTDRALLQPGDQFTLGSSCQITFRQPVPGCLSARLELGGGRRLPYAADGVLLMADMLVLGPGEQVHVPMPELSQPLYVAKRKDQLGVRWPGDFTVEGEKCRDWAALPAEGSVSAEAFSFAVEPAAGKG